MAGDGSQRRRTGPRRPIWPTEWRGAAGTLVRWLSSCRSSAGRPSPTPSASAPSPTTSPAPGAVVTRSSSSCRRWARRPTSCCTWPARSPSTRPGREMDMLITAGERKAMALALHGPRRRRVSGDVVHGESGRDHDRHDPHQGPHRRASGRPHPRRPRRRQRPGRRWRPGRVDHPRGDLPRAGWIRHHRGGPGPGAGGGRVRAVHRRAGCLLGRPADRAVGPPARHGELRRDVGDVRLRVPEAGDAGRGVRPDPRGPPPRPVQFHVGAWHLDSTGGRLDGAGDHLGGDPRHLRGQGHRDPDARPPRHRRLAVPIPGRPECQRRHDRAELRRAERSGRRHHGHLVHRPQGRSRRRSRRVPAAGRPSSRRSRCCPTRASPRCRSSGRG